MDSTMQPALPPSPSPSQRQGTIRRAMRMLLSRITGKYRRTMANQFCRRMVAIKTSAPLISFTFDDAPRTAFNTGGDILRAHGARATFFVSLGLLGSATEVGTIASPADLARALQDGNELGCHTSDRLDARPNETARSAAHVAR